MAFLEEQFGDWKPVSRLAGIAWLSFYAIFLLYAFTSRSGFLFLDYANLIIHEGGHFFFSCSAKPSTSSEEPLVNSSSLCSAPPTFSSNAKPPASPSPSSGSSKISLTSAHTWPTLEPPFCLSSAPPHSNSRDSPLNLSIVC